MALCRLFAVIAASAALLTAGSVSAAPATLNQLLSEVRATWKSERAENKKRVQDFQADKAQQTQKLKAAMAALANLQNQSETLEARFADNERKIAALEETKRIRLGTMGELFGVIKQISGDTRAKLESSVISTQLPGRADTLQGLAQGKELPHIDELRHLWFILQQEIVEQGRVTQFPAEIVLPNGDKVKKDVIRAGVFNVMTTDGKYLDFDPLTGKMLELARQPAGKYGSGIEELAGAAQGSNSGVGIDFTKGAILNALVQTPSVRERLEYGGTIGYIIIAMGILAALLALVLLVRLLFISAKMKSVGAKPSDATPLGRIIKAALSGDKTPEVLEHRLEQAILNESSRLEAFLWLVRIVSVVAPLMGLLGTVTGMIQTFQSITLFGTGDPKRMAGGISEALVTTMLGLIVAITLTLIYSWLKNISDRLVAILDEQGAGVVARTIESESGLGVRTAGEAPGGFL